MNKVFISYIHKDEEWKDRLIPYFSTLQKYGLLEVWHDRQIEGGANWLQEIENAAKSARMAILLISENFFNSTFIMEKEAPWLLERQEKGLVRILPFALSDGEGQAQSFSQARDYLQQALVGLREAGVQEFIARGLFERAAFYRSQNEFAPASADLEEAREIAERGEMKLFLADYHLEACRVCLAEGKREAGGGRTEAAEKKKQEAEEHLRVASKMIEEMGYGRRRPEVEELRKESKIVGTTGPVAPTTPQFHATSI